MQDHIFGQSLKPPGPVMANLLCLAQIFSQTYNWSNHSLWLVVPAEYVWTHHDRHQGCASKSLPASYETGMFQSTSVSDSMPQLLNEQQVHDFVSLHVVLPSEPGLHGISKRKCSKLSLTDDLPVVCFGGISFCLTASLRCGNEAGVGNAAKLH